MAHVDGRVSLSYHEHLERTFRAASDSNRSREYPDTLVFGVDFYDFLQPREYVPLPQDLAA